MALELVQTDTASGCTFGQLIACTGGEIANISATRKAEESGTPGTTSLRVRLLKGGALGFIAQGIAYKAPVPAGYDWLGGTWTIPLLVSQVFHAYIDWIGATVCRFDSACSKLENIGSASFTTTIANTGFTQTLYTNNVTGAAVTPNAGDTIAVLYEFKNNNAGSAKGFRFLPNQTINTPFELSLGGLPSLALLGVGV